MTSVKRARKKNLVTTDFSHNKGYRIRFMKLFIRCLHSLRQSMHWYLKNCFGGQEGWQADKNLIV